jgi:hypothetical protein
MALNISEIIGRFKADVGAVLAGQTILNLCRELGHPWRDRVLGPATTVQVFLLQILHGNTACSAMSRLAEVSFSAAAYCAARMRLPLSLFERLLQRVCDALFPELHETGRWRGHRTWSLDGSSFSMPDTPELQDHFGQPSGQAKGCGFPVAHLLALFHAGTGLLLRVVVSPMRTHDMRHTPLMHTELAEGDVLLADRGFASFAHLALLFMRKMHAVFRCHQRQIVNFRVGRKHTKQRKPKKGLPRSRFDGANKSIVEANAEFASQHVGDGDGVMDDFEIANSRALLEAMLKGFEAAKRGGVFGEPGIYLAMWISDSGHEIMAESVRRLNSAAVVKEYMAEFG